MKIAWAVIHRVLGSRGVREIHTDTQKVRAQHSACCLVLRQQFYHVLCDQKHHKKQRETWFRSIMKQDLGGRYIVVCGVGASKTLWMRLCLELFSAEGCNLSSTAIKPSALDGRVKLILSPLEQQPEISALFLLMPKGCNLQNCKVTPVLSPSSTELYVAHATSLYVAASAKIFIFPSGKRPFSC